MAGGLATCATGADLCVWEGSSFISDALGDRDTGTVESLVAELSGCVLIRTEVLDASPCMELSVLQRSIVLFASVSVDFFVGKDPVGALP